MFSIASLSSACATARLGKFDGQPSCVRTPQSIFLLSAALVSVGALFLLADLSQANRAIMVLFGLGTSIISFGALSIACFIGLSVACFAIESHDRLRKSRKAIAATETLGNAASFATILYTGMFLWSLDHVLFWNTPLVVILFAASSLSCGTAALQMHSFFGGGKHSQPGKPAFDLSVIGATITAIEGIVLLLFMISRILAGGEAAQAATNLLTGSLALQFWCGVILCGLIIPLAMRVVSKRAGSEWPVILNSISTLIGGFALRCCIMGL